jgi:two-component system sensor histidine kinase PilS (NtrC family)
MSPYPEVPSKSRDPQRRRLDRYLVFRFAVILMALGLAAIYQAGIEPNIQVPAFRLLYLLIGIQLAIGLASLFAAARFARTRWFAPVQVGLDFLCGALMAASTGGVVSVFCPILFISLFGACTVVRLRGAVVFASFATLFLALATLGCALDYIPASFHGANWIFKNLNTHFLSTYIIAVGFSLHVVAVLGTQLSTGLLRIQSLQIEILENMCEGLIALNREGRILQINNEARKLLGIDKGADVIGQALDAVLPRAVYVPIHDIFARSGRCRDEVSLELPGGQSVCLEARVSDLDDERGRVRCRIGLLSDLALKKEMQGAARKIRQLEGLHEMALGIAHEIRNPLASIRGCVQEIGRFLKEKKDCSRLVEIVCKESDRLDRIIEEFMNYARKSSRPNRIVDVVRVAEEAVILLRNHTKYPNRVVELAPESAELRIHGDAERIKQVILNLGLNALASTSPERGRVRVAVALARRFRKPERDAIEEKAAGVEIVVEDNGCGIPARFLEKIFSPFFTCREDGVGLGLSIVQRIVHDHGGEIRVESELEHGAKFVVWFPMLSSGAETAAGSAAPAEEKLEEALETA